MPGTANFRGAFSALQIVGVNSFIQPPGQRVQLPNAVIGSYIDFFQQGILRAHAIKKAPRCNRRRGPFSGEKGKRPQSNRDATHISLIW